MGRRERGSLRGAAVGALAFAALTVAPATATAQIPGLPPVPIPTSSAMPQFEGAAATPQPVSGVPDLPQHPFMAANGRSNIHNDAYMSGTYRVSGPLGNGTQVSSTLFFRECGSVGFDRSGRIVTVCVGLDQPVLALLDPGTLEVLASMSLPPRNILGTSNPFSDFSGGGYFYVDHRDHAVVPTTTRHIFDVAIAPGGNSFQLARDYDVSGAVKSGDGIISALPDWGGRLWFVSRNGVVGFVNPGSGRVRSLRLHGEGITNSFAVDRNGGVYIVSDEALYRFDVRDGEPRTTWREVYPNSHVHKPGQSDAGSGTTPDVMGKKRVAIVDNADPMHVLVYNRKARFKRRKRKSRRTKKRLICSEPVFAKGASSTDQSLISTNRSLIVENNYGYAGITSVEQGGTTAPGITRVDVVVKRKKKGKRGKGKASAAKHKKKGRKRARCKTIWTSAERAPSVVPKLSLANGLVYTYAKPLRSDGEDAWYFTALDFRTGRTVYRRLAGVGLGYNNNFAPVTLGPDGAAYVGALGGLVRFADG